MIPFYLFIIIIEKIYIISLIAKYKSNKKSGNLKKKKSYTTKYNLICINFYRKKK